MTRSTQATPLARRRTVLSAALMATAAFGLGVLSACSAGQITQTDTQKAAVPGISVDSADGKIALRDGGIPYADQYKTGATVPLSVHFFNNAQQSVKLTGATSDNGTIVLVGGPQPSVAPTSAAASPSLAAPSGSALPSGTRNPSGSPSTVVPSSPAAAPSPTPTSVGSSAISIEVPPAGVTLLSRDNGGTKYLAVEKLTGEPLMPGGSLENVTFTFTYADGTTTTIKVPSLPMTPPGSPLPKPSSVVGDEGEE
ncbi:hypothetical protein Dvina_01245 [Dactylosporangium vinaceum]|uniref:Lipoprotein n=1 Tax=Dactylosporangium vinaceum TaxID=53362 RepID=A0ABV5MLR0_9ACTN|nr:hypothetical protein [Dactylosporangium vinaceum]UAB96885.1 hypothetical protein Dvina_01245 [Dactylosporangium vinaceum]